MPKSNTGAINIQAIIKEYGILDLSDIKPEDYLIVGKKVGNKRNGTEFLYNVIPVSALGGGGGGVQSVTLNNLSPLFTVANTGTVINPIFTFSAIPQNEKLFYAGPIKNGPAIPTFRAIELTDLPPGVGATSYITSFSTVALVPFLVTHNLNTNDFVYQAREGVNDVVVQVVRINVNQIEVTTNSNANLDMILMK